ncbi:MAG TPA: HAMP domain-containing sensor histidine kinase [Caulobacteraceae bacterium]|jgi:signal transduction histidine kinase
MDSKLVPPLVWQLIVLLLAGIGGETAWREGYYATCAVCVLVGAWAAAHALVRTYARREMDAVTESAWSRAVLQREREARALGAFVDHAPVPLLALRARGSLSALNLAARRFFGADDLVAEPPAALVPAILGATPGRPQTVVLETGGSARAYALTVSELVSEGDMVRVAALVDIQAEIQAAEAAALKELIQVLSHEIMNSLTPVTSLAQTVSELLADEGRPATSQAREAADSIARRSEGLLRFVDAYREMARLPDPRFRQVSVSALLDDVALLFRSRWEGSGVPLEVEPPRPDLTVALDPELLSQALINVLANAAEAALEGGGPPRVRLSAAVAPAGGAVIAVEDNGPGVKLDDPTLIFRPFFTTKSTGTGVGLSLARQIVLAHGGDIALGAPGEGTTILVSL